MCEEPEAERSWPLVTAREKMSALCAWWDELELYERGSGSYHHPQYGL